MGRVIRKQIKGNLNMNEHIAWEPIQKQEPKEGTCGSCRHLDRNYAYLTAPLQYDCKITGESHFERDECDVPNLMLENIQHERNE